MEPVEQMPAPLKEGVHGVFCDIDDTLTTDGKLGAEAYSALWRLKAAGLRLVPVTGRPAGWCDLIARQWPVDAVVGENGALVFYEVGRVLHEMIHPDVARPEVHSLLAQVREAILTEVPGSRVAKDQAYRRFDLAIDFCEEPPDLGLAGAQQIQSVFARHGAHAKISSIHVNGWFGNYDKLDMVRRMAQALWGVTEQALREHYLFCGDSPNDEPMFSFFGLSCGVANVARFVPTLEYPPRFIAKSTGSRGFAEIVEAVLKDKQR
jgi:1,2-diacylglycerol 3-alpha-glucosyltransferase